MDFQLKKLNDPEQRLSLLGSFLESFLGSLCLKGGMSQEAWRDSNTQVKVYEVEYFSE